MADAADSKSAGETRGSSTLPFGTTHDNWRVGTVALPRTCITEDCHAIPAQSLALRTLRQVVVNSRHDGAGTSAARPAWVSSPLCRSIAKHSIAPES